MNRLTGIAACLLLALLAAPGQAHAQTCSATVTDVDFGTPNLLSSDWSDALATLTVTCTRIPLLTVVKLCPNIGDGSGGANGSARLLRSSGGATLAYQLYQDASRTQGWGANDEPQLGTVPAIILGGGLSGGSATQSLTIYARLFGGQSGATTGTYQSVFARAETAFTYSPFFLGTTASCAGFVGSATIRPEFSVAAQAQPGCTLATADLDFGSTGVITGAIAAQTSLRVTCTRGTSYSVALDGGQSNAQPAARQMTSAAGGKITYGLYRDIARNQPWGSTSATRAGGTGTGAQQMLQVHGYVPAQPTPPPGVYADRIVVTVSY